MHICIDLNQSICLCMCLYVYDIQANMHLIQPLSESRYIQIHGYTCRYILVCIQYNPCICDMDCLISGAYVRAYVSYMCFIYIHIYQSICVLYVLQIHAHMHWQDHWCQEAPFQSAAMYRPASMGRPQSRSQRFDLIIDFVLHWF